MKENGSFRRKTLLFVLVFLFLGAGFVLTLGYYIGSKESAAASPVLTSEARWIPFIAGSGPQKPEATVIESNPSQIVVNIKVFGMWSEEIEHEGKTFTRITIPECGFIRETGKASIPVIREMLQIPVGVQPSIEVVNVKEKDFSLEDLGIDRWLDPAQPSVSISAPKPSFVIDKSFYDTDDFYPDESARIIDIGTIRGYSFVHVQFTPLRYNPQKEEIRVCSEIQLAIRLTGSDMLTTQQRLNRYASPPYEALHKALFLNYRSNEELSGSPLSTQKDFGSFLTQLPIGYLIITPASFSNALAPLVDWKTRKGFHVTVAKTSEIGYTKEQIKAYIQNAYDTWEIPPTYLLLVGDVDSIPTYASDSIFVPRTAVDLYYVTMDTNDYLPDILRGRLPAKNTTELSDMVNKILSYEKVQFSDRAWMNKFSLFIGPRDKPDFRMKGIPLRDTLVSLQCIAENMSCDTIKTNNDGTDCDKESIISGKLNAGRSLITFTDHGEELQWNCPHYGQDNVRNLSNLNKYPFILSLCCYTGSFDVDECFGETWIKVDSIGAIAFWGGSTETSFEHNDVMENGIYKAFCDDSIYTVSGSADRGLYYLYQKYGGDDPEVLRQYEAYNILGDPSIDLWMKVCDSLVVTYDNFLKVASDTLRVTVYSNGSPVPGALVCLYKQNDAFETGYTDANGIVDLFINPTMAGVMYVTVTAHNCKPFEGTSSVYKCGDVNGDYQVNTVDVTYLISFLFRGGPPPQPLCLGDVNCDHVVNISDVVYLSNYLYWGGPPPCTQCCD